MTCAVILLGSLRGRCAFPCIAENLSSRSNFALVDSIFSTALSLKQYFQLVMALFTACCKWNEAKSQTYVGRRYEAIGSTCPVSEVCLDPSKARVAERGTFLDILCVLGGMRDTKTHRYGQIIFYWSRISYNDQALLVRCVAAWVPLWQSDCWC